MEGEAEGRLIEEKIPWKFTGSGRMRKQIDL